MRRELAIIIAATAGSLALAQPVARAQQKQPSPQQKKTSKTAMASMTGCVDQQDGRFILIHDQTRSTLANLEAEGFPEEGFAKHVGHKVTVRGTSSPAGTDRPLFKVRSIEPVSDSCGSPH